MANWHRWIPGGILVTGCICNSLLAGRKVTPQPLNGPIASVASTIGGVTGVEDRFTPETEQATGMSSYVYRRYAETAAQPSFSVYVGYYEQQRQGQTIHSPKNCLPGGGWEAVDSRPVTFTSSIGPVTVNRYSVVRPGEAAIVYYWYQGRGRVENNEFRVKYQLLRDATLRGRTEEALVRIIIPIEGNTYQPADALAQEIVGELASDVQRVLPVY